MANVKVINPDITVLEYNQEKQIKTMVLVFGLSSILIQQTVSCSSHLIVVITRMAGVLIPSRF